MGEAKIGENKQREPRDSGLKGKVVLVVSSAQDMGYELAAILAEEGYRIVLAGSIPQLIPTSAHIKSLLPESQVLEVAF